MAHVHDWSGYFSDLLWPSGHSLELVFKCRMAILPAKPYLLSSYVHFKHLSTTLDLHKWSAQLACRGRSYLSTSLLPSLTEMFATVPVKLYILSKLWALFTHFLTYRDLWAGSPNLVCVLLLGTCAPSLALNLKIVFEKTFFVKIRQLLTWLMTHDIFQKVLPQRIVGPNLKSVSLLRKCQH